MLMENFNAKTKIVTEEQLESVVNNGLSYVRVSFPDELYQPVYLAYKERPTTEEIRETIESELCFSYDKCTLTWSEKNDN